MSFSSIVGGVGTLFPHWLARVYPPPSPRVDLVRVHSPSDPVMTSHPGLALHKSPISHPALDITATTTNTATNSTTINEHGRYILIFLTQLNGSSITMSRLKTDLQAKNGKSASKNALIVVTSRVFINNSSSLLPSSRTD